MTNKTELAQSYATRLNQLHAANIEKASGIRFSSIALLNDIRAEGILLEDAKNTLGTNGWKELQTQLDFGSQREQVIQTYLTFARKNPDEITNYTDGHRALNDAMMVTGLLPFPETHGAQALHAPHLFSYAAKAAMAFRAELKKKLSQTPLDRYSKEEREQFADTINPVINELTALRDSAIA
jgi:hypothetical protein